MKRLTIAVWAVFLAAMLAAPALGASASVKVTQVAASGSGTPVTIDPKLKAVEKTLTNTFKFSKYAVVSQKTSSVSQGATANWKLDNGSFLDVTFVATDGKIFTITVEVYTQSGGKRKSIMKVTVKRPKGGSVIYKVGKRKSGETLILVIKAS